MAKNNSGNGSGHRFGYVPSMPFYRVQPKDRFKTSKGERLYWRGAYQIDEKTLKSIYGKSNHKFKGRNIYKGARNAGNRFNQYLMPLGIGNKVKFVDYSLGYETTVDNDRYVVKTRKNFKVGRRIQTHSSRRIIGNLEWNNGVASGTHTNNAWESQIHKRNFRYDGKNKKWGGFPVIKGKYWATHLNIAAHMVEINSVYFVQVMTRFARQIFLKSFSYQGFNGTKWEPLQPSTLRLRRKRGYSSTQILIERGELKESLDMDFVHIPMAGMIGKIYTKNVPDRNGRSVCYAGIHNFGADGVMFNKYPTQIPQRQFMGHSQTIDNFYFKIRNKYFLQDVFTVRA